VLEVFPTFESIVVTELRVATTQCCYNPCSSGHFSEYEQNDALISWCPVNPWIAVNLSCLFSSLFYDAFSVTRTYSVDNRLTSE
jgi:hypothetical protein